MAFNWKSLIEVARSLKDLAEDSTRSEAFLRSAIGRVYYGVYGYTQNYAKDFLGFHAREDADDHGRLRAHLRKKKRYGDSDRLDRLRQWRNDCDYLDELSLDLEKVVTTALELAEKTFASLVPPRKI